MIAETINLVAVLAGRGSERRLAELASVEGLDPVTQDYITASVDTPDTNIITPFVTNTNFTGISR